jgi:hypothetical protein
MPMLATRGSAVGLACQGHVSEDFDALVIREESINSELYP